MERLYGLIGFPLGHSFSARFFTEKFRLEHIPNTRYRNFPIETIENLPRLIEENPTLCGFNVTIPYKEAVIPYLDTVSEEAKTIGAVNCVRIDNGKLTGYNTDAYGFTRSLRELIGEDRPAALVLGTGGASKAVGYSLEKLDIPYRLVSRTGGIDPATGKNRIGYEELTAELIAEFPLVVNTTPLGTFPNVDDAPALPYEAITRKNYLFDLVYNPPMTRFLGEGKNRGAAVRNGYGMLVGQAEKAWEIWTASAKTE